MHFCGFAFFWIFPASIATFVLFSHLFIILIASFFLYDLSALLSSHYLFLFTLHFQQQSVVPLPESRTSVHSIGSLGSPIHCRRPTISFLFSSDYFRNTSWWYLRALLSNVCWLNYLRYVRFYCSFFSTTKPEFT